MHPASVPGFFSGTSNIVLPIRRSDYPPGFSGASRLTYYASLFSSIEINATFYKLPRVATIESWRNSVPEDFRFTFKVPKSITHVKGLQFSVEEVERFAGVIAGAGSKRGCLLVQLPPSAKREREEELEGLLECLSDDAAGWRIAVEFRHGSWYDKAVYRMLQRHGAVMVAQDLPASATPSVEWPAPFVYVRFHGPEGGYRGSYGTAFLEGYADRIAQWIVAGKEVYVYFNNTMGDAYANLQALNAAMQQRRTG